MLPTFDDACDQAHAAGVNVVRRIDRTGPSPRAWVEAAGPVPGWTELDGCCCEVDPEVPYCPRGEGRRAGM